MEKKIGLFLEPTAYFRDRITEVVEEQGFEVSQITEFYLVDLLARFVHVSNLFSIKNEATGQMEKDPLAIMLLKAQNKEISSLDRIRILKKLGDTALYISGFFSESLNRKVIDLDYYRNMGAIAYRNLSGTIRDDSFQELYNELHAKFGRLVDVLTQISQESYIQSSANLLQLYEMYVKTGSEYAKKILQEKGLPFPTFHVPSEKKSKN